MASNSRTPTHWDQRYLSGDTPWNSGIASQELARVLQEERIAPCRAVELGCGTGYTTQKLRAHFPETHLFALDLAPSMTRVAP